VDGEDKGDLTDPSEHRVFDSVVSNLRKTFPKDKMQDISTSFCFIRLLHLANERGLKIEAGECPGAESEEIPGEGDNRIGDLWGLKVKSPFPFSSLVFANLFPLFSRSPEIQIPSPVEGNGHR
jgi:condensin complex subunit 2